MRAAAAVSQLLPLGRLRLQCCCCARAEEKEEARAAAVFKRTSDAKALVKIWKRLRVETTAADSCLPVECWSLILTAMMEPQLWDLSFVRDICNAGTPCRAALLGCLHAARLRPEP